MRKASGSVKKVERVETRGRHPLEDRGDVVLPNGLYAWQWEWIKNEAANKRPKVDAAWFQRWMIQVVIDAVEASRADVKELVTPKDDKEFETLVSKTSKP